MGKYLETRETVPAEPASSGTTAASWQWVRMLSETTNPSNKQNPSAEDVVSPAKPQH